MARKRKKKRTMKVKRVSRNPERVVRYASKVSEAGVHSAYAGKRSPLSMHTQKQRGFGEATSGAALTTINVYG